MGEAVTLGIEMARSSDTGRAADRAMLYKRTDRASERRSAAFREGLHKPGLSAERKVHLAKPRRNFPERRFEPA